SGRERIRSTRSHSGFDDGPGAILGAPERGGKLGSFRDAAPLAQILVERRNPDPGANALDAHVPEAPAKESEEPDLQLVDRREIRMAAFRRKRLVAGPVPGGESFAEAGARSNDRDGAAFVPDTAIELGELALRQADCAGRDRLEIVHQPD